MTKAADQQRAVERERQQHLERLAYECGTTVQNAAAYLANAIRGAVTHMAGLVSEPARPMSDAAFWQQAALGHHGGVSVPVVTDPTTHAMDSSANNKALAEAQAEVAAAYATKLTALYKAACTGTPGADVLDVVLANAGTNKLQVIKAVREITDMGLKEAKDLVESCPKAVKEQVSKADAERFKKLLEEAGATVELKVRQ